MAGERLSSNELGKKGERAACRYLRRRGCRILAKNYRCPFGEIDIVAREGDTMVFLEVKTRASDTFGDPQLAVTPRKRRRVVGAALAFMKRFGLKGCSCRFDVIAVSVGGGRRAEIEWIRNAFGSDGYYMC